MSGQTFFGGIPTAPDIKRLTEVLTVESGTDIAYEKIAAILGVAINSNRFLTITVAWRKLIEREKGLRCKAEGRIFHFCTASEAVSAAITDVTKIGRRIGKTHARVQMVDQARLSDEKRKTHSLLMLETQAMLESVRKSAKAIAGPAAVAPQLRIAK